MRFYGQWMRDEAFKRIGHLYPPVEITEAMAAERPDLEPYVGRKLTVIAWLWARTVHSPNPAFSHVAVPLASTFVLSSKTGKEAYVQPVIGPDGYRFTVQVGKPPPEAKGGTSLGVRKGFRCLMSGSPMDFAYLRAEGCAGRMGQRLMAIVAEGTNCRVYLAPTAAHEQAALHASPTWKPDTPVPEQALSIRVPLYGMKTHGDLYTARQLVALTTFSDLVGEARERIRHDALAAGVPDDDTPLDQCGSGARAYADAVGVYLGFALSRMSNYSSTLCVWSSHPKDELAKQVFMRQALPMTWDFAETNPFTSAGGSLDVIES